MSTKPQPTLPISAVLQSKEFRTVAISTISVTANDNFIYVTFGLELPQHDGSIHNMEEVRLVMTARSLKINAQVLNNTVNAIEAVAGPISLPAGKAEELQSKITTNIPSTQAAPAKRD